MSKNVHTGDSDSSQINADDIDNKFYTDAEAYWKKVPATIDGMLGGFSCISSADIQASDRFLKSLFKIPSGPDNFYAVDCGAGIGRVTQNLLSKHFCNVDLVEQNYSFLAEARSVLQRCRCTCNFICSGLQDFSPPQNKYDIIWCQWVLGHLRDDDLIAFFHRCKVALKPRGIIVVKENISKSEVEMDYNDSSLTRPLDVLKEIFVKSELTVIKQQRQPKFPRELYDVQMFALRPKN